MLVVFSSTSVHIHRALKVLFFQINCNGVSANQEHKHGFVNLTPMVQQCAAFLKGKLD